MCPDGFSEALVRQNCSLIGPLVIAVALSPSPDDGEGHLSVFTSPRRQTGRSTEQLYHRDSPISRTINSQRGLLHNSINTTGSVKEVERDIKCACTSFRAEAFPFGNPLRGTGWSEEKVTLGVQYL
ncbi:hypothetical protein WMY93_001285 [Mugilogobius chulae]|uniref:Uncharacterized protein n=1 Tax=Mugilogobius chulae TaxID=88201 RepID=A0AAW0Q509_9GOBI